MISAPTGDAFIVHADRPRRLGPVGREVVAQLDRLRPHLARAALLSARLEMECVNAAAKTLELIRLPAAVLGTGGRTLAANAPLSP